MVSHFIMLHLLNRKTTSKNNPSIIPISLILKSIASDLQIAIDQSLNKSEAIKKLFPEI